MALRKNMPTRAPEKGQPQDVREYDPQTGGYTRTPDEQRVSRKLAETNRRSSNGTGRWAP
ncbi:hypothetical protein AB0G85_35660 [Streptomyces sioyaensis]|uniref:hypothetical protein n=1 Tax=Streptomyces sioyaensis TaxID=67364 RepID=UPI0033DB7F2B